MRSFQIETSSCEMKSITVSVSQVVEASGVREGLCVVYCPHTTAAVTVNENADPDVVEDLLMALEQSCPDLPGFRHQEGNSAAHLKASLFGSSVTVPISDGRLALGRWQGIYFCEFDGPRKREFYVQVVGQ